MQRPALHRSLRLTAPLALVALLACGQEEVPAPAAQQQPAPNPAARASTRVQPEVQTENVEPRQLLPDDAFLWLECRSLDALEELLGSLSEGFGDGAEDLDMDQALALLAAHGADPAEVRRDAPLGIALSIPSGQDEPVPTFVLPVRDGLAFQRSLDTGQPLGLARIGHYVAVSLDPGYSSSTERALAFCADLPDASLVCRVSVGSLMQRFGPMVQVGLGGMAQQARAQVGGGEAGEAVDTVVQSLLTTLKATRTVDLVLDGDAQHFELDLAVRLDPNSPLARRSEGGRSLADVRHYVDRDDTLAILACCDRSILDGPLGQLMAYVGEAVPELDLRDLIGDQGVALAAFGRFVPGSMEGALITQGVDGEAWEPLFDALGAAGSEPGSGMSLDAPMRATQDGSSFRQVDLVPDDPQDMGRANELGELFGAARVRLRLVSLGDQVVLGFGEGSALAQRAGGVGSELPGDLERALDLCGDAPNAFVYRVDYRGLAMDAGPRLLEPGNDALNTLQQAVERPDDDPAWAVVYGCMDGPTWRMGIRFDPREFVPHLAEQQRVLGGR